jgi:hypothetical protein
MATALAQSISTGNRRAVLTADMPVEVGSQLYQYMLANLLARNWQTPALFLPNWVGKQVFTAAKQLPLPSAFSTVDVVPDGCEHRLLASSCADPFDVLSRQHSRSTADAVKLPLPSSYIHSSHFRPHHVLIRELLQLNPYMRDALERAIAPQASVGDDCVALFARTDDHISVTWYSTWINTRAGALAASGQRLVVFVDGDGNVQSMIGRLVSMSMAARIVFVDVRSTRAACSMDLMRGPAADVVSFHLMSRCNAVLTSALSPLVVAACMCNAQSDPAATGTFVVADFNKQEMVAFDPWATAWES